MSIDVYSWTDSRMKIVPPGDGEWVLEYEHLAAIDEKDAEIAKHKADIISLHADFDAQWERAEMKSKELQDKCDRMEGVVETAKALSERIEFRIDDPRCELHCKLNDALARIVGDV